MNDMDDDDAAPGVKIVALEDTHVDDLAEIVRLNNHSLTDLVRSDLSEWIGRGRPAGHEYFTALDGARPIGMTGFRPDLWGVHDIYWLVWLYIHPDYKRKGIASKLFAHAQSRLREIGCRKAYLDVGNEEHHTAAIAFHKKDGFVLEGHLRDYWREGEDFMIFSKHLSRN